MGEPYQHAVFVLALVVAAASAVFDWRKGVIPVWLTMPTIAIAFVAHFVRFKAAGEAPEDAVHEVGLALFGAGLSAIVPLLLFRQSAIGGGDVRLFIALGAVLQPRLGVEAQMYGFFAGAILAPAKLAYEGKLLTTIKNSFIIGANLFLPKTRQRAVDAAALSWFRLGPAIFFGVALTAYMNW